MNTKAERFGVIRLTAPQLQHPELLTGLEVWLQLGLLSGTQVKQFCRDYLSCAMPTVAVKPSKTLPSKTPVATHSARAASSSDFASLAEAPEATRPADRVTRTLQAFMAEIGVIWLLCLGVFMVVVSSGVLAASQWRNFSPIGQYSILLAYTLAFWAVSNWTGRNAALRLTTRMLQIATLLIIPVNFWMMDGLGLWRTPAGIGLSLLAAVVLTAIIVTLMPRLSANPARLTLLNSVGLSWLHWGWTWGWTWGWVVAGIPLVAAYIGTIGTAVLTDLQLRRARQPQAASLTTLMITLALLLLLGRAILGAQVPLSQLGLAFGVCGWLFCRWSDSALPVESSRSIQSAAQASHLSGSVDLSSHSSQNIRSVSQTSPFAASWWTNIGVGLLLLGWAVTVADNPWQAVAVSGLGLWLLAGRLRQGRHLPLIALLLLGLQTYMQLWRLLPIDWRQALLTAASQWFGADGMPIVLLSLAGFPYLWLMLVLAKQLRSPMPRLAQTTELLALGLGGFLVTIGLINPLVRSISLTLATVTLTLKLRHRGLASGWIYFNHLLILATVGAWLDAWLPNLEAVDWARLLLLGMAIEWGLSLGRPTVWRQSCWHLGLGMAGLSYPLLLSELVSADTIPHHNLIWLVVPGLLTSMAHLRSAQQPRLAAWLSAAGLVMQFYLLNTVDGWLMGLAVATGLMLLNTALLQHQLAALLTIGFALGFEAMGLYRLFPDWLAFDNLLLWLSANLWLLWCLLPIVWKHDWRQAQLEPIQDSVQTAQSRSGGLKPLYIMAANYWGIGIALFGLLSLSFCGVVAYSLDASGTGISIGGVSGADLANADASSLSEWLDQTRLSVQLVGSSGLIAAAIAYRLWTFGSSELGFYGLAWAIELFAVMLIGWLGGAELPLLATVTLGLGLGSQMVGDWQTRRTPYRLSWHLSWHLIPLLYAGFGLLFGHHAFTAITGLYTLAVALIAVGVGRRQAAAPFKALTVVGLLLGSMAAYELLIYQLMQAESGKFGDGMTLLAGLASLIAFSSRISQRWIQPYLRLPGSTLRQVAHLHWGLGSSLALIAPVQLSDQGCLLWLLFTALLTAYALLYGRTSSQSSNQFANQSSNQFSDQSSNQSSNLTSHQFSSRFWTYCGIWQALGMVGYIFYRILPFELLSNWAAAMAAGIAIGLYFSPWQRWGWPQRPWCNVAIWLPGLITLLTARPISLQSLLMVAAFYAWIAKAERHPRLSYISVFLFDWALLRYLAINNWLNLTWIGSLLAATLLYIAQIDPAFQSASAKEQRHWLRSLAVALLSLTLFYQAEVEVNPLALMMRLLTLVVAIGLILIGLAIRVRAFLYIGTLTFVLAVLRLLWLFVNNYSLLLWAIGIVIGLVFIWIAATFEARRSQMSALVQYWVSELGQWE